ncbi:molecular chaperone [Serratia sp. J2]|uniref:fimbrial biogenesis chaperone n=1 Tax=Serratia sp. J2 TaxID=3386551 RepID=UPI0039170F96
MSVFNKKKLFIILYLLTYIAGMKNVSAGVMINNTRIIYEQKYKSANVTLTNVTTGHYAVQVWINGESDRSDEKSAFVATPSIFRLDPGQEQIVKILSLPASLPKDREAVYYFNAQEIPATNKADNNNKLVMAIRTRIKVFYRPSNLAIAPQKAATTLQWKTVDKEGKTWLQVTNPSPYYITFAEMAFRNGTQKVDAHDPEMLPPLSTQSYPLNQKTSSSEGSVDFSIINDYGGITHYSNTPIQK